MYIMFIWISLYIYEVPLLYKSSFNIHSKLFSYYITITITHSFPWIISGEAYSGEPQNVFSKQSCAYWLLKPKSIIWKLFLVNCFTIFLVDIVQQITSNFMTIYNNNEKSINSLFSMNHSLLQCLVTLWLINNK